MLTLHNSLTREKEEFKPINPGKVGLYTCGPTVYDYAHIGNLRSYIYSDLLYRVLIANGFSVTSVMNITDVDDKTIKRSQDEHKTLKELTEFYTEVFLADLKQINVITPTHLPKATDNIDGMVAMIKTLLGKGFAYQTPNGDIYFGISKDPNYGQLAQLEQQQLKENADGRLSNSDEYEKDDVRDFALWKAYDESDGDIFWETELGKGRPGWHIECSVMSVRYLGQPFDIHTGGVDLIFPHHTNEIAQSLAAGAQPLANYWIHPEHLLVDNAKMSKSKNNYYTSKDILEKGLTLTAFRYLILSSHYKSKLNFTWESLQAAQNALNNLYEEISAYSEPTTPLSPFEESFNEAVNDDLNTAKALAVVWDLVKSQNDSGAKLATLLKFDKVLGLSLNEVWESTKTLPENIKDLAEQREIARDNKDFSKSDELRKEIEQLGYVVEDTLDGTKVKKKY